MTVSQFRSTIVGSPILALLAQTHRYEGVSTPGVGVLLLRFAEHRWVRFGIDAGHFHWREVSAPEPIPAEGPNEYPVVDLGHDQAWIGRRIEGVVWRDTPDGGVLSIAIEGDGEIIVANESDQTDITRPGQAAV